MAEEGLQEVKTYVSYRQNRVAQYIETRPIMDQCMAAKRRAGTRVSMRWWEHEGMDLEGMQTAESEVDQTEGDEYMERKETATDY